MKYRSLLNFENLTDRKIIAVVVTYNRIGLLKKSIGALRRNKPLDEIIVVENGCTDGTYEWLEAQKDLVVIHQDNVGGSGGFHSGIKAAYERGAAWIWCMDDDVFPRQDCLEKMLQHAGCADTGIMSPRRISGGRIFTHEFRRYDFSNPFGSMHGRKIPKKGITEPTAIVGADFEGPLIRREVVDRIGLPNKDFFIFCDDTEYCLRTHLDGWKIAYIPDAVMDKHVFFNDDTWTERNRKKKWKRYYQIRNEAYLNHHYGRNWGVKYLRSLIGVVGYMIPAIASMPFCNAWQMKDILMLWKAYWDGIKERLGKRE